MTGLVRTLTVAAILAAALLAVPGVVGAPPARVELFSPTASAPRVEQIKVRFATPMVAFGDPRLPAPIVGNCSAGATGRWTDAQSYAIDLPAPLPGGKRCTYALVAGLKDAAGAPVTGQSKFGFTTGGPSVRAMAPSAGSGAIDEDQVFLLALNSPPTAASIAAHASCLIEGVGEAVPIDVLPAATVGKLLKDGAGEWRVRQLLEAAGWQKPEYGDEPIPPRATILGVHCRRTLPAGGKLSLRWGAAIADANGQLAGDDNRYDFKVRPAFAARFECSRVNAAASCSPLEAMRVAFTDEVPVAQALAVRLLTPDGRALSPEPPKRKGATLGEVRFTGPFVERSRYKVQLPAGLTDQSGRPLSNAARFPLEVATGDFPPLVKFAGSFGILEAREGGVLPVTLRAVEIHLEGNKTAPLTGRAMAVPTDAQVAQWLRVLDKAEERTSIEEPIAGSDDTRTIETTRSTPLIRGNAPVSGFRLDRKDARAMEVVGIPLAAKGFHVVEIASPALGAALLGRGQTRYVAAGALVTDMSVHFLWGRGSSLVWVTHLADATPVAGARIAISDRCSGTVLWTGTTGRDGRAAVGDSLPEPASYGSCEYKGSDHPMMVSARAGDDYSFTMSSWGSGIQPGDFILYQGYGFDRTAAHAIFDRTLLKAGDTVSMKLLLRTRTDAGFGRAPAYADPTVVIRHLGSDATVELPVRLDAGGTGELRWPIPTSAALGDYRVEIGERGASDRLTAGQFRVDEYRLPTIRATVSGPKARQVAPTAVPLDLALTYLSGGAVGKAPVKLRTIVQPRTVTVANYDGWRFDGEELQAGIVPLDASGDDDEEPAAKPTRARVEPVSLGGNGVARVVVDKLPAVTAPSTLVAEMDYDDANGEVATTGTRIELDPAALRVGIKTDGWLAKADDLRLKLVVLGLDNAPVKGVRVEVKLFSRETYSYRKRLIGGFYAYDNSRETRELSTKCSGTSDAQGLVSCQLDPGVSGEVVAQAVVSDSAGRVARATTSVWLAGDDDWWFGGDNGDRMDVVPESIEVAAGGTAKLQVRMPFREATALVSVVRDGVISSFVTTLSGKDPVVEVPMARGYAPNVYVEVLAVRGRVAGWRLWLADLARRWNLPWFSREAASPTALVDLAKPSYRLGIAQLKVGWDDHRLGVSVKTDKPTYAVKQQATAQVTVTAPRGQALPRDAEIAFAAVDEALLQLAPNDSWKLLEAMMAERPIAVVTATAQTQVVGKRHYGRKAVAAGGGGGDMSGMARRDFNPLLLWRGRVPLNAHGQAVLTVPLNDSLSGFRLVAVATAGSDLFGTGSATIRTTQDLQLLAGVPPLVREGDNYVATTLLRNTTAAPLVVTVTAHVGNSDLRPLTATVPAGGATPLAWRVMAPGNAGTAIWTIDARAATGQHDRVQVTQIVAPAVPDQIWQATLFQPGAPFPIGLPQGAIPGRGGIDVSVSRSLGGTLPGVRAYMAAYPYDCIEQRLSRAVALGDRAMWEAAAGALPGYLDGDGLVRYFPADWIAGDDSLTAYVLRLSAASGWAIPEPARGRMIAGLTRFATGKLERSHALVLVVDKASGRASLANLGGDGPPRLLAAVAALAAQGAATPAMLEPLAIAPDSWPTISIIDWLDVLTLLPDAPNRAANMARAEAAIRTRLDLQGTTLRITRADDPWQILASPDATAAQLLSAIVARPAWKADAGLIARALMLRQQRGHWDTTPANALGTLAMRDFARVFETAPVTGTTTVSAGSASHAFAWSADPAPATLAWPAAPAPLTIAHNGSGAPWITVSSRAAVPLRQPFASGFALSRAVSAVTQAVPGRWSRGDVMRVRVTFTARAPVEWVVINDPVPAGATILGGPLGGRSEILAGADASGTQPTFVERRGDAVHAHYASVDRGAVTYEYTVRLGSAGIFAMPPTRVEALYSPEMMAMIPNAAVTVAPK